MKLPCPQPAMKVNCAMMINILGQETMEETKAIFRKAMSLPGAGIHWYCKLESRTGRKMGHITLISSNFSALRSDALSLGVDDVLAQFADKAPRVGIIMGSDSDLPTMKDAAEILEQFGVSYELKIVSAHRTPNRMYTYAQTAAERGIEVIIAGAGGAAHLPGMVAALTTLPVIGVPVKTSTLAGTDSLLSIVQMPKGIPVATVAIGNAANAGLLAVRILASTGDGELRNKMESFLMKQEDEVLVKADRLELHGYKAYLEGSVK
jgi:phosphoribosylaminoimidazole carboxylase